MSRDQVLYLLDIKESCEAIFEYLKDIESAQDLIKDRKTYQATIREFEIIGEAVSHLSKDIKEKFTEIEWRDIKDFRNLLIHEYFGIDYEIVYKTAKNDLENLYIIINKILKEKLE